MKNFKQHILIITVFLFCQNMYAQVVNIEEKRASDTSKHLQGSIELSVDFTKNNNSILEGENEIQLQYFKGKNMFLFLNELTLMRVDGESYLDEGFQHLRYNRQLKPKVLIGEAFAQYQYNGAQNIDYRFLAGLGPRLRIIDRDSLSFFAGPLFMYEQEQLTDSIKTTKFRNSTYISISAILSKSITWNMVSYYQPNLEDLEDFRFIGETSMKFRINEFLAYKVLFEIHYSSRPASGIQKLDYALENALSVSF